MLVISGCASTAKASPEAGLHLPTAPTGRTTPTAGTATVAPSYDDAPGSDCPADSTDPAIAKLRTAPPRTLLPKDFRVVAVVRCTSGAHVAQRANSQLSDTKPIDSKFTNTQLADSKSIGSKFANLINALHEPSQTPTPGKQLICTAIGLQVPTFGLVGADGTVIRPQLPLTACGMPMLDFMNALNDLPWTTESGATTDQSGNQPGNVSGDQSNNGSSNGAVLPSKPPAGCPAQTEYLIGWPVGESAVPWSQVRHPNMPPIALVCVFRVDYGSAPEPLGTLVGGVSLTADQTAEIQRIVDLAGSPAAELSPTSPPYSAGALADCPQPVHTDRFVSLGGPNDPIYLADLGGCSQLRFPNGYLSVVPSGLADLLAQIGIN